MLHLYQAFNIYITHYPSQYTSVCTTINSMPFSFQAMSAIDNFMFLFCSSMIVLFEFYRIWIIQLQVLMNIMQSCSGILSVPFNTLRYKSCWVCRNYKVERNNYLGNNLECVSGVRCHAPLPDVEHHAAPPYLLNISIWSLNSFALH